MHAAARSEPGGGKGYAMKAKKEECVWLVQYSSDKTTWDYVDGISLSRKEARQEVQDQKAEDENDGAKFYYRIRKAVLV